MIIKIILQALTGTFETDMTRASKTAQKRMKEIEKNAAVVGKAIGLALTTAATAFAVGLKRAIDQADRINDLNVRLGISAEALSGWAYAAKQTGTDIDALGLGFKKLSKNIAEAVDPKSGAAGIFSALNIDAIDKTTGKLRDIESIMPEIADAFKNLHNETLEEALALQLFGKSGDQLLEFLNLGSAGIEDMRAKLRGMGGELDEKTIKAADEFKDKLDDLNTEVNALFTAIAADLLPELIALTKAFEDNYTSAGKVNESAHDIGNILRFVGEMCIATVDTVKGLTSALIGLGVGAKAVFESITGQVDAAKKSFGDAREEFQEFARRFGFADAPAPAAAKQRAPSSQSSGPTNTRRNPHRAQIDEARLMAAVAGVTDTAAKATRGKSEADKAAAEAAKRHADALKDLQEKLADQAQAAIDLKTSIEDMTAKAAGPMAELTLEFLRQEEALKKLAETAGESAAPALALLGAEYSKSAEAIAAQKTPIDELLSDMEFELDLLGKTNAQRIVANELRRLEVGMSDAQIEAYEKENAAKIKLIETNAKALESQQAQISAMDEFRANLTDNIAAVLDGSKSIGDAFKDMANAIIAQIARMIAQQWVKKLFGEDGTSGSGTSGGNWVGAFFSMFGGGSAKGNIFDAGKMIPFASGGVVGSPTLFGMGGNRVGLMGEAGAEAIMPLKRGVDGKLGIAGGHNITQIFQVQGLLNKQTQNQLEKKQGREVRRALSRA